MRSPFNRVLLRAARWLAVAALIPAPVSGDETVAQTVPEQLVRLVQNARNAEGSAPLEHRARLDDAAATRAALLAERPVERILAARPPLGAFLSRLGLGPYRNVHEHVFVESGHRDPAEGAFRALVDRAATWSAVRDREMDGIGAAEADTVDGLRLLLLLVVSDGPQQAELREAERGIFDRTNSVRRLEGRPALTLSPALATIARAHSEEMARRGFFAHVDPEGGTLADRASNSGYTYRRMTENLLAMKRGGEIAAFAVRYWIDSPSHRENLLDARVSESGSGAAVAPDGTIYVTQLFATPTR